MKGLMVVIVLAVLVGLGTAPVARAKSLPQSTQSETLCLPRVYETTPEDCLALGPSDYLTRQAQNGITFPIESLAAQDPDPELMRLPYSYAKVITDTAPVFSTIDEAADKNAIPRRYIEAGFDYISYTALRVVEGKKYYQINIGEWMRGSDLNAGIATSRFMGKQFLRTPERKFGWILSPIETKLTPGNAILDFTGRIYNRYEMIQIYSSVTIDGLVWYLIGPDEWVEARHSNLALVYPAAEAPEGIENGRWIEINLLEQTVSVYENGQLVFASLTSSGVYGYWTRPGLFQITKKQESTPMTGSFVASRSDYYYLEDVPWTMYFDEARAFHGTYWHNQFGYELSKGCANLSPGDSQWLFNWAAVGDWVYVWDPSGETPEDPSLYGSGGA